MYYIFYSISRDVAKNQQFFLGPIKNICDFMQLEKVGVRLWHARE